MNANRLLAHFERISDAPDAVDRLRTLVLSLAYAGRLLPGVESLEANWHHSTVGELATEIVPGLACSKSHQTPKGHVHLRTHNVATNGRLNFDLVIRVDPRKLTLEKSGLRRGDVIFNNTNSQELVGKTCLVDQDYEYAFSNHLTRIRLNGQVAPEFFTGYFQLLLRKGFFAKLCNRWIGQAGINTTALKGIAFVFPALPEQHRIVAKVDELMQLCDRLEASQKEREGRRDRLVVASLNRLSQATDPDEFKKDAGFQLSNLNHLSTKPEHIKELRKAILNLAVRGKLVPQDEREQGADAVLAGGVELPDTVHRRRKILKKHPGLRKDAEATHLPRGWVCCQVQELYAANAILDYADGNHGSLYPRSTEFGNDGVLFATARDLVAGRVHWEKCAKLNDKKARQLTKGWSQGGDVLLTHNATVGRVALVEVGVTPFLLGTSVTFYRLHEQVFLNRFFFYFLQSDPWQSQLQEIMAQTTRNQVSIQKQALFRVVVPPLAEQKRIVAKVDELMLICDQLENRIDSQQKGRRQLLEALLHEAMEGVG